MATTSAAVEYARAIVLVLALQSIAWVSQERIVANGGRGFDGTTYHAIAEQIADGRRPAGESRFVRRIGTPFLAAHLAPDNLILGYQLINGIASFFSALLLVAWLRRCVGNAWIRLALLAAYATHWLQLVRFTSFYAVIADPLAQLLCFAGLLAIQSYERRPSSWKVIAVSLIAGLGVCVREVVLLVPVSFFFARDITRRFRGDGVRLARIIAIPRAGQFVPLACAVAALVAVGMYVVATDPGFSSSRHLLERARGRNPIAYVSGWFTAFGPALCLLAFDWRKTLRVLARHPWMAMYLAGVALLGWAGSLESERHALYWASPIVLALIGQSIHRHRAWLVRSKAMALLIAGQLIVHRVFWAIPQPAERQGLRDLTMFLTPVGSDVTYLDLFPDYMPPDLAWTALTQHLGLVAVVLVAMHLRARRVVGKPPLLTQVRSAGGRAWRAATAGGMRAAAGVRQMGVRRGLTVLLLGFVPAATVAAGVALQLQPHRPVPIHVRWRPEVDPSRQAMIERQLGLINARWSEGRTWIYRLTDPSTARIRAIVTHFYVEDTHHINRIWFRPEISNDRERRAAMIGVLIGGALAMVLLLGTGARRQGRRSRVG